MKLKQILIALSAIAALGVATISFTAPVGAAPNDNPQECRAAGGEWNDRLDGGTCIGYTPEPSSSSVTEECEGNSENCCAGVKTSVIGGDLCEGATNDGSVENSAIWRILIWILQTMTIGVGVLAVAGIAYGAVLYTSAADKPDQVKKATKIFTNVVIGLLLYGLMYAILNFLIPGGIFDV